MQAIITRPMKVLGDNGGLQSFLPSCKEQPFVEIQDATFQRLVRAGAAKPYIPETATKSASVGGSAEKPEKTKSTVSTKSKSKEIA